MISCISKSVVNYQKIVQKKNSNSTVSNIDIKDGVKSGKRETISIHVDHKNNGGSAKKIDLDKFVF